MRRRAFARLITCCYLSQCLCAAAARGRQVPSSAARAQSKSRPNAAKASDRQPSDPAASPIFSMSVQSGIFKDTPWPPMPVAGIRLWDTFTNWSMLEPSRGKYDWPALDRWLDAAKAHGVDVLYTFGGTPTWASSNPTGKCDYNPGGCYAPLNMQDWDDFVTALATHAAGRIKYWELWNEANQHEYWSGGIPALVTMAQHAYAIIKSVDPSAKVFTPSGVGGSGDVPAFLDSFLAAGGGQFVDGVAFHGYVNSIPGVPEDVNRIVDAVQSVMAKRGLSGKPLWDTESSWGPANHLFGDDERVAFVARHYILQWSKGVQRDYWYAWNDTNYGTLWDIATRKMTRAGTAYVEMDHWLNGAEMTAPCVVSADSTWTCEFMLRGGTPAQVVWNSSLSASSTMTFRAAAKYLQCRSLDGTSAPIYGGTVPIGSKPVLLIAAAADSTKGPASPGNGRTK